MNLIDFIELIKKFANIKSDQEIFDAFFLCFEENELVKRKSKDAYGFDSGSISKIMNGTREIPKTYIDAAKKINIKYIEESIKKHLINKIDKEDIKRIKTNIVKNISNDNYYTQEEKEQIISKSYDDDSCSFLAYVFIRILLKTGQNNSNNSLSIKCYFDNKTSNNIKCASLLEKGNTVLKNIELKIDELISTINSSYLKDESKEKKRITSNNNNSDGNQKIINNNIENIDLESIDLKAIEESNKIFEDLSKKIEPIINLTNKLSKKLVFSDENKFIVNTYAEKMEKTLSDDFFDLGNMTESTLTSPFFSSEKYGTDKEKEKYNNLIKLVKTINHYVSLANFLHYQELNFSLTMVLDNESSLDDKNILLTLYFPKNSISYNPSFLFDDSITSQYFIKLYEDYLKIDETSEIELCSFVPGSEPVVATHINTDYLGRYDEELEINNNANDCYEKLNVYKFVNNSDFDILRFEFYGIRKKSMCFFPAPILLRTIPNKIKYEIKSSNNDSKIIGYIK